MKEINKLRHESIHPGKEIFVPKRTEKHDDNPKPRNEEDAVPTQYHVVTEKDTISTVALIYGMKVSSHRSSDAK